MIRHKLQNGVILRQKKGFYSKRNYILAIGQFIGSENNSHYGLLQRSRFIKQMQNTNR